MQKKDHTPQEKKVLSLEKDRRNTFGENDKASRKNIPRSKAISHREARRKASASARAWERFEDETQELVESTLSKHSLQKPKWKKTPDEPLGDVLNRRKKIEQEL